MSTQEEADTRVLLHAVHAAAAGYKAAVIASDDTNVFVLCLAFKSLIAYPLFVKRTRQTRTVLIDISKVITILGSQVRRALLDCMPSQDATVLVPFSRRARCKG